MKNSTHYFKVPLSLLSLSKKTNQPYDFNLYQLAPSGDYQVIPKHIVEAEDFFKSNLKSKRLPLFVSREDKNLLIEFIGQMTGGQGDGFTPNQIKEATQLLSPLVEMVCSDLRSHLPQPLRDQFISTEEVLKLTVLDLAKDSRGLSIILRLLCGHDYLIRHSFLVCSLSFILANELGYSKDERRSISLGALLHDIGLLRIDEDIYVKPTLNEEDWEVMKAHPIVGEKMLSELTHLGSDVLDIIAGHHSQPNGRGYGRAGSKLSHLVGTIDAFSTMIMPTPYRSLPLTLQQAWISLKEDEGHFEREFVQQIKDVLIQPHLKKAS